MALQFVKSQKKDGKYKLIHEGSLHDEYRRNDAGEIFYRCDCYTAAKGSCSRRVVVQNQVVKETYGQHNHIGDPTLVNKAVFKAEVKANALDNRDPARRVIADTLQNLSSPVKATIKIDQISRNIRNVRQTAVNPPVAPQNLMELEFPEEYKRLKSGELFLLSDSGPGAQRIVIFSTQKDMDALNNTAQWAADGTFKTAPPLFQQLYTIHIRQDHQYIPVVYILMSHRTLDAYTAAFTKLLELRPTLSPNKIYTDFEAGAIAAFRQLFNQVPLIMKGCFFHHSQAFQRKLQEVGFKERYEGDEVFAVQARMITALAFVPINSVCEYFEHLSENLPDDFEPLLTYYEENYIGRILRGNRRRAGRYSHDLWNVYEESLGEELKTTNSLEGWHRAFSGSLGAIHPTIWKFIDFLRSEQSLNSTKLTSHAAGTTNPQQKKYVEAASKIRNVVERFFTTPPLDYLKSIAYNLKL